MLGLLVLVVAALPTAPPELLVDLDSQLSRSRPPRLLAANADGVLFAHGVPEGGMALFWATWDGPSVRVATLSSTGGLRAVPFADGFIVFREVDGRFNVERFSVAPEPQLELLTTVIDATGFPSNDSVGRLWWSGPDGTFVTDGTKGGTRKVTPLPDPRAVLGDVIYFSDASWILRWEAGDVRPLSIPSQSPSIRAGNHLVFTGTNPFNEERTALSTELTNSSCTALPADRFAWLLCETPDAGRDIVVTDGTPAGTSVRFHDSELFELRVANDDQLIFSGGFDGGFGFMKIAREGAGPPTSFPCRPISLFGNTVLCTTGVSSLSGAEVVPFGAATPGNIFQAGTRAVFQQSGEVRFLLSDGTRVGSRRVPGELPARPTESSRPKLFASDGVHALYTTTLGTFITDGTRDGTFRVGDDAEFFGHSVLASDGAFFVHGENGEKWQAPFGVLGVAGGVLVGKIGCDAFTIDEAQRRTALTEVGCVERIEVGRDGALLRNSAGETFLLRKGHAPWLLPGDVQLSGGVTCGTASCWFLVKENDGSFRAHRLHLESSQESSITVPLNRALPFRASDTVFVSEPEWGELFALHPNQTRTELDFHFTIAPDGRLLGMLRDGVTVIDGQQQQPSRALPGCVAPRGITVTGNTVHALCSGRERSLLFSGPLDGGSLDWSITEGPKDPLVQQAPTLPSGSDVWAFSITDFQASEGEFVMSDGTKTVKTPGLVGADFTKVRGGYVFAGTKTGDITDLELWVVPEKAEGCTCGQGGVLCSLGLVLLLRRRSFRRAGR